MYVIEDNTQQEAFRERRHLHVCDLLHWLLIWPNFKVKKAYVIGCCLLYCALVPGIMSMNIIVCEIWPLIHFLWPLTFTCNLELMSMSLKLQSVNVPYVVVHYYQVWSFYVQQNLKYGQFFAENLNDVTMTSSHIQILSN